MSVTRKDTDTFLTMKTLPGGCGELLSTTLRTQPLSPRRQPQLLILPPFFQYAVNPYYNQPHSDLLSSADLVRTS